MDPRFGGFPDSVDTFEFDDEVLSPSFDKAPDLLNGFQFKEQPLDIKFMDNNSFPLTVDPGNRPPFSSVSSEVDSPDDNDSDPVFKYLNQILLEENMEERPSMFHDPFALQAAEKSFFDVLGQNPPPPHRLDQNADSPDSLFGSSSDYSITSSGTSDPQWIGDLGNRSSGVQNIALDNSSHSSSQISLQLPYSSVNGSSTNGQVDDLSYANVIPNIFSDADSILQFKKGMEEASKFLPTGNPLFIDLEKHQLPPKFDQVPSQPVIKVEKDERYDSPNALRGKKHPHRQKSELEEQRSSKQSAVYVEEVELSEMFDRVLLRTDANGNPCWCCPDDSMPDGADKTKKQNELPNRPSSVKSRLRNQESKTEAVDLRTLLISCAQSVAADDRRTAYEQLRQIRQHSSTSGDAYQRLANVFANGLEARLAGTGTELYAALASRRISATEKLKAYQVYLSACPFKKISIFFANKMIAHVASKAKTLHIVDFGIQYGFQWPILIQYLSTSPDGPTRLRITGIERPQPGFRPTERVEETGRRLAKYCERFKVPFEYQAIAIENWDTIKLEDLKIAKGEVVAVNCLFRFNNLLDETVVVNNPRDAVLRLIRKMNPNIFVNSVVTGLFNAPFFVTRFREALFHYSSLFDMLDTTLLRDNQQRFNIEQEFFGREAINVIACEGPERVERPETYKQWQVRYGRTGFKPLPLMQEILNKLSCKSKVGYHKDFVFGEDGNWMLQGWKGRIMCASSCWVPA